MRLVNIVFGDASEKYPVWAFVFESHEGYRTKVIVVDRPKKRIICLPVSFGCMRTCIFCASSVRHQRRFLSAGEMETLAEKVISCLILPKQEGRILISLMGVGDPADNPEAPVFLRSISPFFRTALATTVPRLRAVDTLMEVSPDTKVTVSLHAGTRLTRVRVLQDHSIVSPIDIINHYRDSVEYNYVTIQDMNDGVHEAVYLNEMSRGSTMRLKLNTLNEWPGIPVKPGFFPVYVLNPNIKVEEYSTDGTSVFGACGQCGYELK